VLEQGGIPFISHPHISGVHSALMAPLKGLVGLDIYNAMCQGSGRRGVATRQWDELLTNGRRVWGWAADDRHSDDEPTPPPGCLPNRDHGKAWIMVRADERSQKAILDAIRHGLFFSTTGPLIKDLRVESDAILVQCTHAMENIANGDGPPRGREFEMTGLLRFIKQKQIRNLAWVTGDVHYVAAHHYDPARAAFSDFDPFWEFVAGPIHAGTYPPQRLDSTFGPQVKFQSVPVDLKPKRPPSEGKQFFGLARIDPNTRVLTVTLRDLKNRELYRVPLSPHVQI
jgi:hypothetical protein